MKYLRRFNSINESSDQKVNLKEIIEDYFLELVTDNSIQVLYKYGYYTKDNQISHGEEYGAVPIYRYILTLNYVDNTKLIAIKNRLNKDNQFKIVKFLCRSESNMEDDSVSGSTCINIYLTYNQDKIEKNEIVDKLEKVIGKSYIAFPSHRHNSFTKSTFVDVTIKKEDIKKNSNVIRDSDVLQKYTISHLANEPMIKNIIVAEIDNIKKAVTDLKLYKSHEENKTLLLSTYTSSLYDVLVYVKCTFDRVLPTNQKKGIFNFIEKQSGGDIQVRIGIHFHIIQSDEEPKISDLDIVHHSNGYDDDYYEDDDEEIYFDEDISRIPRLEYKDEYDDD